MKAPSVDALFPPSKFLGAAQNSVSFWFRHFGAGLLATFLSQSASFATAPEISIEGPDGDLSRGKVSAWGSNRFGQTDVPAGLSDVRAVAAGYAHTVALKNDGTLSAWGRNQRGQISVPPGLNGVQAIAAGYAHTVALRANGTVVAWGANEFGKAMVPLNAQTGVKAIAAGFHHTVALKADGAVIAWGSDEFGQSTVPLAATSGVRAIAAGDTHTVALKTDGSVVAWGWNIHGQTNVPVEAQSGVVAIAAGSFHTLALKADGAVIAWGRRFDGQTNVPATASSGTLAIAAGGYHSIALKEDGTLAAWGSNADGQTTFPPGIAGVEGIAAGEFFSVAIRNSTVAFAQQPIGEASTATTFTIRNTGDAPLHITRVNVIGGDAGAFAVGASTLSQIPAAGAANFSVTFTPTKSGLHTTTLRVLSDDADEAAFDIALTGLGAPPPAEDDAGFTTRKSAIDIDVLANDPAVNRSTATITFASLPLHGRLRVIGGKVRYIPTRALPLTGDSFTYHFDDGQGGVGTGTVTIDNFAAIAAPYDGLVQANDAASAVDRHNESGYLRVALTKTGALTGSLMLGGSRLNSARRTKAPQFTFVGRVNSDGEYVRRFVRPNQPPVTLSLKVNADSRTITGTAVTNDPATGFASTFTLGARTIAREIAGKHDVQIAPDFAPGIPDGTSRARVRVTRRGDVIVAGRLADGQAFSSATLLHVDRSFPLYAPLYRGHAAERGSLRGTLQIPSENARALPTANAIEWFKPPRPSDRLFPDGFEASSSAVFLE